MHKDLVHGLKAGLLGSIAAAVIIFAILPAVANYGVFYPPALVLMTILVAIALYVYFSFKRALGERWFSRLGPPVIAASAAGVLMLWLGEPLGAGVIAIAYFGEPVLGYFVYRKLLSTDKTWAAIFLASAAAYAYTLPAVLIGLWHLPFVADFAKLIALIKLAQKV